MNNCFTQEYCTRTSRYVRVSLCFLLFISIKFSLYGQDVVEDYRGIWQIEAPNNGTLILIVKRNGLASYFWANNSDLNVYQGKWSNDASDTVLQWQDGSTHRISRDTSGYAITYNDNMEVERYTVKAQRLPEKLLGQWAKAPSMEDERLSDRAQAKGFFGTWKIEAENDVYYIIIEDDRSAASNRTRESLNPNGLRGSWAKQGSELHIAWDSGHYGILRQNERNYGFKLIAPGEIIENDLSEEHLATRTDNEKIPSKWYADYIAEKEIFGSNIAFTDPQNVSSFYRGAWIVQRTPETFERIDIGRFGGLKTSMDHTLEGDWRMSRQDIFMRWDDGIRKILSPIGQGFLLYEYKSGRPLDGVPTRIFSATPQNAKKLATQTKGQKTAAKQLLNLAEANGMFTSNKKETGWEQSFARWAWPFDKAETSQPAEPLLQPTVDSSDTINPWWWPFWSEVPDSSLESKAVTPPEKEVTYIDEINEKKTMSETGHLNTIPQNSTPPAKKPEMPQTVKAADWEWPF